MRKLLLTTIAAATALALTSPVVQAQSAVDLASAVRTALDTNPEVGARLNALRASIDAIDVAKGARLPRVDLEAEAGRTTDRLSTRSPQSANLTRNGVAVSASQLLWDGLAVQRDVERLGHERMARWFELNDASEQTALDVARAWLDVQRMRRLVALAEDSYVQHRYAFDQIQSRVRAGVGRGVDQEQAWARLTLAESNLVTEKSNLHDVSERFLRLVGERPPAAMPRAQGLERSLPADAAQAALMATRQAPAINAAIENLRAARSTKQAHESVWQPRIEARARVGAGRNFDGVPDQKRDANVGVFLNWNLYNGGSDQARIRQQANVVNQATDLRDKACRDSRQTATIAFNDTRKLAEQVVLLDRNTLATEKARDAYRQQFDIGQRSLLDLLNSESELYTARRAYTNAEYDLSLAHARVQAAGGVLITALGLRPVDPGQLAPEAGQWNAGDDVARCPHGPVAPAFADRSELDNRARALMQPSPWIGATPAPAEPANTANPPPAAAAGR